MNGLRRFVRDDGNIMLVSVVIVALLIATGFGFMSWSSDERWDTEYERTTIQAYFLAQTGLIEQGLQYLRTRSPGDLPVGTVFLPSRTIPDVGSYLNTTVRRVTELGVGDVFQRTDVYDLNSTGRATFINHQLGSRGYGSKVRVERAATMRTRLRSFANYMYLTDKEKTIYDEVIWFWSHDSLYGRTHSNDYIGLEFSPHFYGPISTSQDRFLYRDPQDIYFKYPPVFNAPKVFFPREATTLRAGALETISSEDGRYMTHLTLRSDGSIEVYQYILGIPEEPLNHRVIPLPGWGALFVDGQVEVEGLVNTQLSIGSADDMWLVDNVRYVGSDPTNGQFNDTTMIPMLGLISEKNIYIRDNVPNGRENGFGNSSPNEIDHHSIIINAGMVALYESFTFQHQNDDWDSYQGPSPDERGIIHLKGAVTQARRGYVHRSNHQGTGYGKDYHYDFRFDRRPPPFYLEALDEQGHGLFDIVSWGEISPRK